MGHDILIVDDERDICTLIAGILEDEGHTARRAHNSTEATDAVRQRRPALVILDVWLQGSELDGLQLLEVIRREEPPVPVVMISATARSTPPCRRSRPAPTTSSRSPSRPTACCWWSIAPSRPIGCGARTSACAGARAAR